MSEAALARLVELGAALIELVPRPNMMAGLVLLLAAVADVGLRRHLGAGVRACLHAAVIARIAVPVDIATPLGIFRPLTIHVPLEAAAGASTPTPFFASDAAWTAPHSPSLPSLPLVVVPVYVLVAFALVARLVCARVDLARRLRTCTPPPAEIGVHLVRASTCMPSSAHSSRASRARASCFRQRSSSRSTAIPSRPSYATSSLTCAGATTCSCSSYSSRPASSGPCCRFGSPHGACAP